MSTEWLTVQDVADYLKLGKTKIYQYVQQGRIPGYKVGGQWRFQRTEIDEWIRSGQSDFHEEDEPSVSVIAN
jgi:excisionase family DNA binding protein